MFRETVHRISLLLTFLVFSLFVVSEVVVRTFTYFFPEELQYWTVLINAVVVASLVFWVGIVIVRDSLKPTYDMLRKLEAFNLHASHELKTPLANILASLDLALKTKKESHILKAKEATLAMNQDIDNMLALTQISSENIQKQKVDVIPVIDRVIDKVRLVRGREHRFNLSNPTNLYISCDAGLLEHIIRNIVTNAVKYSEPNTTISITAKPRYLKITDEGFGMSEEFRDKAFTMFSQETKSNSQGQGI